ncbi:MAG: hypothetical protein U0703_11645 [Anaerolineae bacterium]
MFYDDCLFVGDVGRPDLLETAAGVVGSSEPGARDQFRNVQRFKTCRLSSGFPGHGAGSACWQGAWLAAFDHARLARQPGFSACR